jgi:hypothetical protein
MKDSYFKIIGDNVNFYKEDDFLNEDNDIKEVLLRKAKEVISKKFNL